MESFFKLREMSNGNSTIKCSCLRDKTPDFKQYFFYVTEPPIRQQFRICERSKWAEKKYKPKKKKRKTFMCIFIYFNAIRICPHY